MTIINEKIIEDFRAHLKREEKSKNTVEKYLRDGHSGERTAVHYDGGGEKRQGCRDPQRQGADDISCKIPAKKFARLYRNPQNRVRNRFRHPYGQTDESHQHMERDEITVRAGNGQPAKGVPPQFAPPVCTRVLRYRKGHCNAGRYSRSQQRQHHYDLYCQHRHGAPPQNGINEADPIKKAAENPTAT